MPTNRWEETHVPAESPLARALGDSDLPSQLHLRKAPSARAVGRVITLRGGLCDSADGDDVGRETAAHVST